MTWLLPIGGSGVTGERLFPGRRGGDRLAGLTSAFPKRFLAARSEQSAARTQSQPRPCFVPASSFTQLNAAWAWTRGGALVTVSRHGTEGGKGSALEAQIPGRAHVAPLGQAKHHLSGGGTPSSG